MNDKKETTSSGFSTESGSKERDYTVTNNSIKNAGEKQGIVERNLKKGIENAITSSELVEITGCGSSRRLRLLVSKEREKGALILSSDSGYFLPDDGKKGKEEAERFISCLSARALNTLKVLHSAKRFISDLDGQQHIEDM